MLSIFGGSLDKSNESKKNLASQFMAKIELPYLIFSKSFLNVFYTSEL